MSGAPLLARAGLLRGAAALIAGRGGGRARRGGGGMAAAFSSSPAAAAAAGGGAGAESGGKPIIRGVCFDMDGTLTVPVIDFALMRRKGDILDVINSWPEEERARAYAAIAEIEAAALADMKLMPGLHELCEALDAAGVPRGLITRNVKSSVEYFHSNHLTSLNLSPFEPAISRECAFPYKPSPAALLHVAESWGVAPSEVVMVGDSPKDDIVCGNRAGALTVLLDVDGRHSAGGAGELSGEAAPTHVVASMGELRRLLLERYRLLPPLRDQRAAAGAE
ncbi:hypothetical protein Rsub_08313 [Raphidocelis subcapitata]|uniref:Haloacid dehalogenase-like hydrolase domain-containing protein n=1 Tax=Raphidocelis subcapitata TaxID=307507 RepID=A0A2V0P8L4_9CHLO|nr:hypothetical protein Rsub_08313 [Raphidocelis subcapitata]|eukprot:GBF95282.1 hypothetical protein Rsub_08313 [Raphidocelis subcapitata]